MNVAMFTDSYLPNCDGVVSSILSYRRALEEEGHRMFVFAPDADMAKKEHGVYRFAAVRFPPYPEYRAAIFPFVSPEIARKNGIGLVHCKAMVNMGIAAISFASRCKLPAMASLETLIPEGSHYIIPLEGARKIGRKIGWAYLKWFYKHFRLVSAPSRHAQSLLAQNGIESVVLPSPVDTDRFRPEAADGAKVRKEMGLASKRVIATVGRVVKEKNYSFLVKVAKKMREPDAVFLIVGKGPYLDELRKEAFAAGVSNRFVFAGFVPPERLVDYYNAADAFVFPSRFETQGLTLLEALSCGKPSCVIGDSPMEEVVAEGKNGFVFGDDEGECAEKLSACLQKGAKMAGAARKSALEYSVPKCTKRLLGAYGSLLE